MATTLRPSHLNNACSDKLICSVYLYLFNIIISKHCVRSESDFIAWNIIHSHWPKEHGR